MNESGKLRAAFEDSVARVCKANLPYYAGPVSVRLFLVLNRRTDPHVLVRPCLEALKLAGVIASDRQVTHFSYYRETARAKQRDSIGIAVTEVRASGRPAGSAAVKAAGKRRTPRPGRECPARLRPAARETALKPGA